VTSGSLDLGAVERILLRRQARQVERVEDPEAPFSGQGPIWTVAPHVPEVLREVWKVRRSARGCYDVGPFVFPFVWIAANELGRTSGGKRPAAPSARQREALAACTAAFNGVHDTIAWFIEHTPGGPELERLQALMAPFEALLARNPPPAAKGAAAGKGAASGSASPPTEGAPG
jgi:hypothetical protein